MTEGRYVMGLERAYRGEVFGEAVYAMAARLTRDPDRRRKWKALAQLETLTKTRLSKTLALAGVSVREHAARRWLGAAAGLLVGALPWRFTMALLGVITRSSTPFFERLDSQSAECGGSHVGGLGAHERAQSQFVRRELAGDEEHSLDDVLALLRGGDMDSGANT
ncbi:MAG: hypothetical protein ABI910_11665 [Gemmatimonadota bacterium]